MSLSYPPIQRTHRTSCAWPAWFLMAFALAAHFCFPAIPPGQEPARSDEGLQTVRLQLKWRHQFQFAGYYAAVEKGFYREAKLSVHLAEGLVDTSPEDEVVTGRAQYGIGQSHLLVEHARGKPVVVLAAIFQHSPDVLVARKDAGISNPQDLIGHTIVLGSPGAEAVRAMLLREGVRLDKLTLLQVDQNHAGLFSGKAVAAGGYVTDLPHLLQRKGIPYALIDPINYGVDFYGDCLFTSGQELRDHPDRARAFREASLRGWSYAMAHPEEIIELILRRYPSPLDREALAYEARAVRALMLPDLIEIGHMNPGRWQRMAETCAELGLIPRGHSLDGFLYDPNPEPNHAWLFWVLSMAGAGVLAFGGGTALLWVVNQQLQKAVQKRTSELRQSEEKFAKAFLASPVAISISRLSDGSIVDVNEVFEQRTGYRRDEVLGRTMGDLGIWEDECELTRAFERIRAEGRVRNIECRFRSKNGESRVALVSAETMDLEGERCILAVAAEITELKAKEAELHGRNRELMLLYRVMEATAATMEPAVVLEVACKELALALALPQASAFLLNDDKTALTLVAQFDVRGTGSLPGSPILLSQDLTRFLQELKEPLALDDAPPDPMHRQLGDLLDRRNLASSLMLPLLIESEVAGHIVLKSGEPNRFESDEVNLGRSVAGQVAAALARVRLSETRRHLMAAIEQTPESVIITDVQGRIIYVNPTFEQNTGYGREEILGRNPNVLSSGKQDDAFYQALWARINAGEVWHGRFINRAKDGRLYTDDAAIAPVRDERGTVVNYIGIQRNITRELELEEQFRQAQKMESVGRLAGGVAHDFNNILTVIMGNADLALMKLPPEDPLRSELDGIRDGAAHAASLTRQLLAFARRQIVAPRLLNLNELISHLEKMLHRLIGEDIRIRYQTTPDLGQIKADPGQIEQVLLNLVVNARDAMPEGGTITIRTENVAMAAADLPPHAELAPGDYVLLSISDTGVGMTDEVKLHIFEPFFTTKEAGKGTGLGLATCFGIVKQGEGHISFESRRGHGTIFKIHFPAIRAETPAASAHEGKPALPRGDETILLVEDELGLRLLLARFLRTQGYTVWEAGNGREALELMSERGKGFDLLLSDIVMPEVGGRNLADQVRSICPGAKILFVSGYTSAALVREAVSRPGVSFLQKPFSMSDLAQKVRSVLEAAS